MLRVNNNRLDLLVYDKRNKEITLTEVETTWWDELWTVQVEIMKINDIANELSLIYNLRVRTSPYALAGDRIEW